MEMKNVSFKSETTSNYHILRSIAICNQERAISVAMHKKKKCEFETFAIDETYVLHFS